ncbi:hypothetical protein MMC32_008099 [Xylographa parallela]|nr:hypothetical protein [Xylographa parallela]
MSSRPGLRLLQTFRQFRAPVRRVTSKRFETSQAASSIPTQGLAQRLWTSPGSSDEGNPILAEVKTIVLRIDELTCLKWLIVLAGVSDFARPAENLSLTQNLALTTTGAIWTRWCFVIKPRNVLLATVNFFLGCVGVAQVTRILMYQRSVKNGTVGQVVKEDARDIAETEKGTSKDIAAKV